MKPRLAAVAAAVLLAACATTPDEPLRATAKLEPTKGSKTFGEATFEQVGDKVRELMDEARRDAQHVKDEMVTAGKAEINAERERATKELSMAKDQALKELWEQSASLATLISAKTIKRDLGVDDHRRLLDDALAEMDKSIQNKRGEAWGTKA